MRRSTLTRLLRRDSNLPKENSGYLFTCFPSVSVLLLFSFPRKGKTSDKDSRSMNELFVVTISYIKENYKDLDRRRLRRLGTLVPNTLTKLPNEPWLISSLKKWFSFTLLPLGTVSQRNVNYSEHQLTLFLEWSRYRNPWFTVDMK